MANPGSVLSPKQIEFYNSKGYLVLESFSKAQEIVDMRSRMEQLLDQFDCSTSVIFSNKDHSPAKVQYFFNSAHNISFFFEEKAFDKDGKLKQPNQFSINKVGHALHELDPVFRRFSYSEAFARMLSSLNYKRHAVVQSMYISSR